MAAGWKGGKAASTTEPTPVAEAMWTFLSVLVMMIFGIIVIIIFVRGVVALVADAIRCILPSKPKDQSQPMGSGRSASSSGRKPVRSPDLDMSGSSGNEEHKLNSATSSMKDTGVRKRVSAPSGSSNDSTQQDHAMPCRKDPAQRARAGMSAEEARAAVIAAQVAEAEQFNARMTEPPSLAEKRRELHLLHAPLFNELVRMCGFDQRLPKAMLVDALVKAYCATGPQLRYMRYIAGAKQIIITAGDIYKISTASEWIDANK
jgi:hypothetical protein